MRRWRLYVRYAITTRGWNNNIYSGWPLPLIVSAYAQKASNASTRMRDRWRARNRRLVNSSLHYFALTINSANGVCCLQISRGSTRIGFSAVSAVLDTLESLVFFTSTSRFEKPHSLTPSFQPSRRRLCPALALNCLISHKENRFSFVYGTLPITSAPSWI